MPPFLLSLVVLDPLRCPTRQKAGAAGWAGVRGESLTESTTRHKQQLLRLRQGDSWHTVACRMPLACVPYHRAKRCRPTPMSGSRRTRCVHEWLKKNPVVRCLIERTQVRSAPQS